VNAAFEQGLLLYDQGRFDSAATRFHDALAAEPQNAGAHAMLAMALEAGSGPWAPRIRDAIGHAEAAVQLSPENAFVHYALSIVLSDLLDWEPSRLERTALPGGMRAAPSISARRALDAASEAIRLEPREPAHHAQHAYLHLVSERWREALQAADAGLALHPSHRICLRWRAMALTGLDRTAEAEEARQQLLAAHPNDARVHADVGFAHLRGSDSQAARQSFLESLRLDPTLPDAHRGLESSEILLTMPVHESGMLLSPGRDRLNSDLAEHSLTTWQKILIGLALVPLVIVLIEDRLDYKGPFIRLLSLLF